LACPCCGRMEFPQWFVDMLQTLRDVANLVRREIEEEQGIDIPEIKLVFESGYRCPKHDREIGGRGEHTKAAVDVRYSNSLMCWILIEAGRRVGIKRIGLNRGTIHFGAVSSMPSPRFWHYYNKKVGVR